MSERDQEVVIDYTNYRGERRERRIIPHNMFYGRSAWHDGPQWFLTATDPKKGERRDFAMTDIHSWRAA